MFSSILLQYKCVLLIAVTSSSTSMFVSPNKASYIELINIGENAPANLLDGRIVIRRKKIVATLSTIGYIQDVFWSSNGKYVAINNRNAESGDYLWVVSLVDGVVIKKPFDQIPMHDITEQHPKYSEFNLYKQWIFARGWDSNNNLLIREDDFYENMPTYLSTDLVYSVRKNAIYLISQVTTEHSRN
jgi:hypothetical protein